MFMHFLKMAPLTALLESACAFDGERYAKFCRCLKSVVPAKDLTKLSGKSRSG